MQRHCRIGRYLFFLLNSAWGTPDSIGGCAILSSGVALSAVRINRCVLRWASLTRHSADPYYHTDGFYAGLCQQSEGPSQFAMLV